MLDQVATKEHSKLVETDFRDPRVLRVESPELIETTYIIESPSALEILLSPWMVGAELAEFARKSSADFLRAALDLSPELQHATLEQATEVVPLVGSIYYRMGQAFKDVFGEALNRCVVGARRLLTDRGWETELSYLNFEALSERPVVIIGDTIATGGTIEKILDATISQGSDIQAILIYSIAGGVWGAMRLSKFARRIDIPVYMVYSNAIFGVDANGTDMPWLHPGTISSTETFDRAVESYGENLARKWCTIWDWGERAKQPVKHLQLLLERCQMELEQDLSEGYTAIIENIQNKTIGALKHWHTKLSLLERS